MPADIQVDDALQKAEEINAQTERLIREAFDPAKDLGRLVDDADKEIRQLVDLSKRKDLPPGAGIGCLMAAVDLIADFSEVEVAVIQGLSEAGPGGRTSPQPRLTPRRGMRI